MPELLHSLYSKTTLQLMINDRENEKNRIKKTITTMTNSQHNKPKGIAKISFFCHSWEEKIIHGKPFLEKLIACVVKEGNIFLT